MNLDRLGGRRRLVFPDRVDGVGLDGLELGADALADALELAFLAQRVQPRIEAERLAGLEIVLQPGIEPCSGERELREGVRIGLLARLDGIAPIDEDRRLVAERGGDACRTGETGQPRQAVVARATYSPWWTSERGMMKPSRPRRDSS